MDGIDKKEVGFAAHGKSAPSASIILPATGDAKAEPGNRIPVTKGQSPDEPSMEIKPIGDVLAEPEDSLSKKRPFISAGEHIDHWSKYLTIDWIWNATSSACFAYWGKFTNLGKKLWDEPLNTGFNFVLKPMIKNPENLKASVKWGNTFMSIIAGGLMFTIPPLLVLENKKVKLKIIKFYDGLIYGKDKVENDPKFQQAYKEIEDAPKKGFWPNFFSRYIALAPLLASVIYKPTREWQAKHIFSHVATGTRALADKIGLTPERLFKNFSQEERMARWNYIHDDAIAMDLSFGLPYAVMHSFFYNMLAKWQHKSELKDKEDAKPQTVIASQTPSVPAPDIETSTKWTDTVPKADTHALSAHLASKDASANFVEKIADKTSAERQMA